MQGRVAGRGKQGGIRGRTLGLLAQRPSRLARPQRARGGRLLERVSREARTSEQRPPRRRMAWLGVGKRRGWGLLLPLCRRPGAVVFRRARLRRASDCLPRRLLSLGLTRIPSVLLAALHRGPGQSQLLEAREVNQRLIISVVPREGGGTRLGRGWWVVLWI